MTFSGFPRPGEVSGSLKKGTKISYDKFGLDCPVMTKVLNPIGGQNYCEAAVHSSGRVYLGHAANIKRLDGYTTTIMHSPNTADIKNMRIRGDYLVCSSSYYVYLYRIRPDGALQLVGNYDGANNLVPMDLILTDNFIYILYGTQMSKINYNLVQQWNLSSGMGANQRFAVDESVDVLYVGGTASSNIFKYYASTGAAIDSIPFLSYGSYASVMATDGKGNLYVRGTSPTDTIYKFGSNNQYKGSFNANANGITQPNWIIYRNGFFYVAGGGGLFKFTENLMLIYKILHPITQDRIDVNENGKIYSVLLGAGTNSNFYEFNENLIIGG